MQSPDFVEGVSGWRLSKDRLELYGMAAPVILGRLDAPEPENGSGVIADVDGTLSDTWSVKVASTPSGEKYAAGIGPGIESQFLVSADRLAINAYRPEDAMKAAGMTSMLDAMASTISETSLGKDLLSEISKSPEIAEQIRDVIRAELKRGGMLYRG